MKHTIKKEKQEGKFIRLPQRESGIFDLPLGAFKLYAWLISHDDGYTFSNYFIRKGTKMRYESIKNALKDLVKANRISITNDTITIYGSITNDTITSDTNALDIDSNALDIGSITNDTKIVSQVDTKKIIEDKEEEKIEDNVISINIEEKFPASTSQELSSQFVIGEAQSKLIQEYLRFNQDNPKKKKMPFNKYESLYVYTLYALINKSKGIELSNSDLANAIKDNTSMNQIIPSMYTLIIQDKTTSEESIEIINKLKLKS